MAIKEAGFYQEQTGVTATSDAIKLDARVENSVAQILTSGSPSTGAKLQFTLDDHALIDATTASWFDASSGNKTTSYGQEALRGATGVRLAATDGTWKLQARRRPRNSSC